jgi:hypothetical protein
MEVYNDDMNSVRQEANFQHLIFYTISATVLDSFQPCLDVSHVISKSKFTYF